ncbi:MAG: hypothetical protein ABI772_07355 [Bacteroidota bacterium]
MKNIAWVTLVALNLLAVSCKKDTNDSDPDPVVPVSEATDFTPLKTGNYWVYERYEVDSSGNATALNTFDSCYVEGDSVINGVTYSKYIKPDYVSNTNVTLLLRDSADYLISSNGQLLFSDNDTTTIFYSYYYTAIPDTICLMQVKMTELNVMSTVPAGTFLSCDARTTYTMTPVFSSNGAVRIRHQRFGANIGIISETLEFFLSNPLYTERRLIRYHLN